MAEANRVSPVPRKAPRKKAEPARITGLTYEAYLKLPVTNQPCSVINGELIVAASPNGNHQWILANIAMALRSHVESRRLGLVLFAPMDVLIRRELLRIRQPDVLFLSADRVSLDELRKMRTITVAPDLVIEILSPSETRKSVEAKLRDFQSIGTQEAWIVTPKTGTVEVLHLSTDPWKSSGVFRSGQTVQSEILPDLTLSVDQIFA